MRKISIINNHGIEWHDTTKLFDLDFADDIALLSSSQNGMQQITSTLAEEAAKVYLRISCDKTKVMQINGTITAYYYRPRLAKRS